MKHIDPSSLSFLPELLAFSQLFLGFNLAKDGRLIQTIKPVLVPLLPAVLNAVYAHLLTFDITAAPFAVADSRTGCC
jgi:Protoglobin